VTTPTRADFRASVQNLCRDFPGSYWRALDKSRDYPEAFVQAMTRAGFLGALIPEEYGGMGLSLAETSIILEAGATQSGGRAAGARHGPISPGTLG